MNIFQWFERTSEISWVVTSTLFAAALILFSGLRIRKAVAQDGGVLPDEGFTVRNVFELMVEFLMDLGENTMGDRARQYFPIAGTIFFFVLFANLMGLVPGFKGATGDANVTYAWATVSFIVYNYVGIKEHGWKYIFQFMGPAIWNPTIGGKTYHFRPLAILFLPLEIVLHFARILTLGIRLLANMFADHTVVMVFIGLAPIAVPAIFMGLGMLVCFLQAFVFALLTMIYIGQALEEAH